MLSNEVHSQPVGDADHDFGAAVIHDREHDISPSPPGARKPIL